MPIADYPYNLIRGLSDFWQRFFADADQLDALYRGMSIQIGQAYLDLLSATLGVSLRDAVALDREYYRLITIREDEVAFSEGATSDSHRWEFPLPDPVVSFAMLDNRVVEPTASLEPNRDYEVVDRVVRFHVDPTDPIGAGTPLAGYARRAIDVEVGGTFTDPGVATWLASGAKKGDTLRVLDVGTDGTQRKRMDHTIVLVRAAALYVSADTPLLTTATLPVSNVNYVVLRVPPVPDVAAESFTLAANAATLAHTRIDQGSVKVLAKAPDGSDVVEGVDYLINYEHGQIFALTEWIGIVAGAGTFALDYTWKEEIIPTSGTSPRVDSTGVVSTLETTTRVLQMALWAPDTLVDRLTLANNFGSFIGRMQPSSEAYRAFLSGVFQLYVLGPVLERIESALNVVLKFPVVRDDGEIFQSIDTADPLVDRLFTTRPSTGLTVTYEFPKGTPFRTDLVAGLELLSFEPLTTVVSVVDYIQTPNWWHGAVIPEELFTPASNAPPAIGRRTASAAYIEHVVGAVDSPVVGDPGLIVGADETGLVPPAIEFAIQDLTTGSNDIDVATVDGGPATALWGAVLRYNEKGSIGNGYIFHFSISDGLPSGYVELRDGQYYDVNLDQWVVGRATGMLVAQSGVTVTMMEAAVATSQVIHVWQPDALNQAKFAAYSGDPASVVCVFAGGIDHPVFRHRLAFVLMDRYLKYHTFSVKFDILAVSAAVGDEFAQSIRDLNELVLASRPSHTYVFTTPTTFFRDEIAIEEDPISFNRLVGSRVFGPDKVIFTDGPPVVGAGIWLVGDYFKYELFTTNTAFPSIGVPVVLANAPVAPRHGRLVRVFVDGLIGGKKLVENVDYSVNYANRSVTRLTAWTGTTVNVTYRQVNIGNTTNAPKGVGDMPILVNGNDPALITAAFNPAAAGWDGVNTPVTAPRDMGMVERALIVNPH